MLVPQVQSPEFFARQVQYLANDEVPATAVAIIEFDARNYGQQFVLGGLASNQAMQRIGVGPGYELATCSRTKACWGCLRCRSASPLSAATIAC